MQFVRVAGTEKADGPGFANGALSVEDMPESALENDEKLTEIMIVKREKAVRSKNRSVMEIIMLLQMRIGRQVNHDFSPEKLRFNINIVSFFQKTSFFMKKRRYFIWHQMLNSQRGEIKNVKNRSFRNLDFVLR